MEEPEPWHRWQVTQLAAWEARRPLFLAAAAGLLGLLAWAARRRRFDQVALLGMLAIPILFYPANYYYHYVALLPLVAVAGRERGDEPATRPFAAIGVGLLALCVGQHFSLASRWADECFTWQSWMLLALVAATPVTLLLAERRAAATAQARAAVAVGT